MGLFDFLKGPDIQQGVREYGETPGAVPAGKDAPLFVYCHSGARSSQAVGLLARMGYVHAKNIGGMAAYRGKMER